MAWLGDWVATMIKVAVGGVAIYSICEATNNRTMANLAKFVAILIAVQITFFAIAKPIQSAHKKVNEIEQKLEKSQNFLDKLFLFGRSDPSKVQTDTELLDRYKK